MAEAASAQQAAKATAEDTSQQRAGRRRRTSPEPRRAQQGATAAAAPAALDTLSRLQQLADASPQAAQLRRLQALADASPQAAQLRRLQALADASPQAAQLRRLQALADAHYAPVAQLAGAPEEEERVQGNFASAELQPQLQQAPRANNTGLPDKLKSGLESLSGLSMDHVRVHYNSAQPEQLNALAYAQGSDIHLAPGQEQHLPHEAWHVVQQAQGRVRPTLQMKDGVQVNDDAGLEREADVMGPRAARGSDSAEGFHDACEAPRWAQQSIQRKTIAQAGCLPQEYEEQDEVNLYNYRFVEKGRMYKRNIQASGSGVFKVTERQTEEAEIIGTITNKMEWLDGKFTLPRLPSKIDWPGDKGKNKFESEFKHLLKSNDISELSKSWTPDNKGRENAKQFTEEFNNNRNPYRNREYIGLVDPFVARTTLTDEEKKDWTYDTTYSNSAYGYITTVIDPDINLMAKMVPSKDFDKQKYEEVADSRESIFSSAHVYPPTNPTIKDQLDESYNVDRDKKSQFHERIDAQTKLIAEGARFAPFKKAGAALRPDSRFYGSIPISIGQIYKFATYVTITQKWAQWFGRAYNIPAQTICEKVDGDAKTDYVILADQMPRPKIDYDLVNDRFFEPGYQTGFNPEWLASIGINPEVSQRRPSLLSKFATPQPNPDEHK